MDIKKHSSGLTDLLLLHSDRRDQALSLLHPGARTMSLLEYRRRQQAQITETLAEAAFYKALIDECQTEVTHLVDGADTPEKRREVLPAVEQLNTIAEQAAVRLQEMTDG